MLRQGVVGDGRRSKGDAETLVEVIGDGRHAALTSEEPHPWGTVVEVRSPHAAGVRGVGTLGAGRGGPACQLARPSPPGRVDDGQ